MAQHVPRLEVLPGGGLLEHEVLGERFLRVAQVQPGQHHRLCAAARTRRRVDPEDAGLPQFIRRERVGGARVAPAHVPEIFSEDGAVILPRRLRFEQRLVGLRELAADERRQIDVRGQLHRAVVRRLDPAPRRQHVQHQILGSFCIQHAESDGQHEFLRLERELQRPQIGAARFRLRLQVDLGDEEFHRLPDVGAQRRARPFGNPVAVLGKPCLEAIGLLRRQHHDVVFADGVRGLDGDAQRLAPLRLLLRHGHRRGGVHRADRARIFRLARIGIEVLGEARRAVGIEALENPALADVDLPPLEHPRHRHDQRELRQFPAVVVRHGDDRLALAADEDHLRCLVEEGGIGFADEKATKRLRVRQGE